MICAFALQIHETIADIQGLNAKFSELRLKLSARRHVKGSEATLDQYDSYNYHDQRQYLVVL